MELTACVVRRVVVTVRRVVAVALVVIRLGPTSVSDGSAADVVTTAVSSDVDDGPPIRTPDGTDGFTGRPASPAPNRAR